MAVKFPSSNSGSYIDCGNIALPAGDWAIFFGVNIGSLSGANAAQCWVCIGNPSDTIAGDAGALTIGTHNPAGASTYDLNKAMVTGKDDNGLDIAIRSVANYMGFGTTRNVLAGLAMFNSGNCLFVLQKSGTEIQLWMVKGPRTATLLSKTLAKGAWAGIASKPLLLGAMNRSTKTAFTSVSSLLQRFGKVSQSLTGSQMEQIFSGADPVALLGMSAGNGDLYWAFDDSSAVVAGATQADSLQGQLATIVGSGWGIPSQIIPLSLTGNDVRLMQRDILHVPTSPGRIRLDGTYRAAGSVINVQCRIVNTSTQAVIIDWTTVASNVSGGSWSGFLNGVTRQILDIDIQVRLVIDTVTQTAVTGLTCQAGIAAIVMGQSLAEAIRTSTSVAVFSNCYTFVASTPPPDASSVYSSAPQRTWNPGYAPEYSFQTCYGEAQLANAVVQGAGCRVVVANPSRGGATIEAWSTDADLLLTRATETMQRMGGGFVVWEQGQSNPGGGYSAKLDTLYGLLSAAFAGYDWQFGVSPIALSLDPNNSSSGLYQVRMEQRNWVIGKIAAGNAAVFHADNGTNDITLVDGVHETGDAAGAGRMAERWAQSILARAGAAAFSGEGPSIQSAKWVGGSQLVQVFIRHNGGASLQTPSAGDITGFEVSLDGGGTWVQPTAAAIADARTINLTLPSIPAQTPLIRYQFGGPGPTPSAGQTTAQRRTAAMIDNPVFDNRAPAVNPTVGFPLGFTIFPVMAESTSGNLAGLGNGAISIGSGMLQL